MRIIVVPAMLICRCASQALRASKLAHAGIAIPMLELELKLLADASATRAKQLPPSGSPQDKQV